MTIACWLELLAPWALPAAVGAAAAIAYRQLRVAARQRSEQQFVKGAKLLDWKNTSYVGRSAGAATLADIALRHPKEYGERVMRVFQSFLDFPPRYGENHRREGQVDYTSVDTKAIMDAINKLADDKRCNYRMRLTEGRPFRVTEEGHVEKNPNYDDPAKRRLKELWHLTHNGPIMPNAWPNLLRHNVWCGKGYATSISLLNQTPGLRECLTSYTIFNLSPENEHLWETIREQRYPQRPSRRNALFAFESKELAMRANAAWFADQDRLLVRFFILQNAQIFRADAKWLDDDARLCQTEDCALRYWEGASTDDPLHEIIVHGPVYFPDWKDWAAPLEPLFGASPSETTVPSPDSAP